MKNEVYNIKTSFSKNTKAEVNFSEDKVLPLLPKKLMDKDIPPFVVSWLIEADSIGWVIQDFLSAPTRSFCRIYCTNESEGIDDEIKDGLIDYDPIEGLPKGIELPKHLLYLIEKAKRLEFWLNRAKKVAQWAEEQGARDEAWIKDANK